MTATTGHRAPAPLSTTRHHVGVVVVTYDSEDVVAALLDSLPAALAGLDSTTVVVDNGSSDGTVALVSRRGDCTVVRETNRGYAAGINRGVAELPQADLVLVLNADVVLHPGSVAPLVEAVDRPGVAVAVPTVLEPDGTVFRSLRREPTLLRALGLTRTGRPALSEHVSEPAAYTCAHAVDWALGAVMLVRREVHEALQGWDESFFLYSEETDFCLRARDRGLATWYEPRAVAVHEGGGSGRSATTHAMQVLNRVRLFRRRHGPLASAAYLGLAVASEVSWVLRGRRSSRVAVRALLRPSTRPAALGLGPGWLPR